jgi:hypothetical protein
MRFIFVLFVSLKLIASDSITLSLATLKGESSYKVWQKTTALKSKLIFPIDAVLLQAGYQKYISTKLFLSLYFQSKLNASNTQGKDYDWKYQNITVYSHSKNNLNSYQDIKLSSSYKTDLFDYTIFADFKHIEFSFSNTVQSDFVKKKNFYEPEKSILYRQNFVLLAFSPSYRQHIKNIHIVISPEVYYGFSFSKDTHIQRDFYTKTKYNGLGYGFKCGLSYDFSKALSINLIYHYFYFKDSDSHMDYMTNQDFKYLSLPSSMKYKENSFKLCIKYSIY